MQHSELPKPLGPDRKWGTVHHAIHGMGFALHDEDNVVLCTLFNWNRTTGLWSVWISNRRPTWMTGGRTIIELGPHDNPPFELAEAVADAAQ